MLAAWPGIFSPSLTTSARAVVQRHHSVRGEYHHACGHALGGRGGGPLQRLYHSTHSKGSCGLSDGALLPVRSCISPLSPPQQPCLQNPYLCLCYHRPDRWCKSGTAGDNLLSLHRRDPHQISTCLVLKS